MGHTVVKSKGLYTLALRTDQFVMCPRKVTLARVAYSRITTNDTTSETLEKDTQPRHMTWLCRDRDGKQRATRETLEGKFSLFRSHILNLTNYFSFVYSWQLDTAGYYESMTTQNNRDTGQTIPDEHHNQLVGWREGWREGRVKCPRHVKQCVLGIISMFFSFILITFQC